MFSGELRTLNALSRAEQDRREVLDPVDGIGTQSARYTTAGAAAVGCNEQRRRV